MPEEYIRKDAPVKLYFSRQGVERAVGEKSFPVCSGKISRIISSSEVEVLIEQEDGEGMRKNICYILYLFSSDRVYMCSCYHKSVFTEQEYKIVSLKLVSPFELVQRRMHQRVSCHSRIWFRQISREEAEKWRDYKEVPVDSESRKLEHESSMVDISGGGIRFISKELFPVDTLLHVSFEITLEKQAMRLQAVGQVVHSMPLRNEKNSYDIRMKFVGLEEEERKQIIHFVFRLERDSINRRWQRGGEFA